MHTPAVYLISALLFILSGLLLFAAGSSWARIAKQRSEADQHIPKSAFRAAAGLTAAALSLLGASILWASGVAFFLHI